MIKTPIKHGYAQITWPHCSPQAQQHRANPTKAGCSFITQPCLLISSRLGQIFVFPWQYLHIYTNYYVTHVDVLICLLLLVD